MASNYTVTDVTMTLASIADANGRSGTQLDNTGKKKELSVEWQIRSGTTAPAADQLYKLYLVRQDGETTAHSDAQIGTTDAAVSTEPKNAILIDSISTFNTANKKHSSSAYFYLSADKWVPVFWNASGQTIHATEADSYVRFFYVDE